MELLPIVFENQNVVIIDKPSGYLSVDARTKEDTRPVAARLLEKQLNCRLWPTHRLDEVVSGLLVLAKNEIAHKALNSAFENQKLKKTYQALTEPTLTHTTNFSQALDLELGKKIILKSKVLIGKKRTYSAEEGKDCETHVVLTHKNDDHLIWEMSPITGKRHQLRYEMSRHGFPIIGDDLYGSTKQFKGNGIALRSIRIVFTPELHSQLMIPLEVSCSGISA